MKKLIIKAIFCAIGHPILFFLFLTLSGLFESDIFLQPLETNVYRLNAWIYLPYALIVYGLWLALQCWVIQKLHHRAPEATLKLKFTATYLILCGLGYINLLFWFIGMEGNVFGFIFSFPLLVLSVILALFEIKLFFKKNA